MTDQEEENKELLSLLADKKYKNVIKNITSSKDYKKDAFKLAVLAQAHESMNDLFKAIQTYSDSLKLSEKPEIRLLLIDTLIRSQNITKAKNELEKLNPQQLEKTTSIINYANLHASVGNNDKSIEIFEKVRKQIIDNNIIKDDLVTNQIIEVSIQISRLYFRIGNYGQAFGNISLALKFDTKKRASLVLLSEVLSHISLDKDKIQPHLFEAIGNCTKAPDISNNRFNHIINFDIYGKIFIERFSDFKLINFSELNNLIKDDLFYNYFSQDGYTSHQIEKGFVNIRKFILLEITKDNFKEIDSKLLIRLMEILVFQANYSEYIWFVDENEKKALVSLKAYLLSVINKKNKPNFIAFLTYYSYFSFNEDILITNYIEKNKLKIDDASIFYEILKEETYDYTKIRNEIGVLTKVKEATSKKVKDFYEESPYPKYKYRESAKEYSNLDISRYVSWIVARQIDNVEAIKKPKILIAGAGTGGPAIRFQTSVNNAEITALDLSFNSLAYGKRIAEENNIKNIEYIQGDILDIKKINRKFDLIHCTGVLHHMKDPEKGLKSLVDVLETGGFMQLAYYSETYKKYLEPYRKMIKDNKYLSELTDIRNFRSQIINSPDNNSPDKINIQRTVDFYNLSMLRDLLFHPQEKFYNLEALKKIFELYKLKFEGFNLGQAALLPHKHKYSKLFPNDVNLTNLDNWSKYEKKYPMTFKAMYQFIVRKQ